MEARWEKPLSPADNQELFCARAETPSGKTRWGFFFFVLKNLKNFEWVTSDGLIVTVKTRKTLSMGSNC